MGTAGGGPGSRGWGHGEGSAAAPLRAERPARPGSAAASCSGAGPRRKAPAASAPNLASGPRAAAPGWGCWDPACSSHSRGALGGWGGEDSRGTPPHAARAPGGAGVPLCPALGLMPGSPSPSFMPKMGVPSDRHISATSPSVALEVSPSPSPSLAGQGTRDVPDLGVGRPQKEEGMRGAGSCPCLAASGPSPGTGGLQCCGCCWGHGDRAAPPTQSLCAPQTGPETTDPGPRGQWGDKGQGG